MFGYGEKSEKGPYLVRALLVLKFLHIKNVYMKLVFCFLSSYLGTIFIVLYFQVLEEIRLGLELNDYGMQQKRIAHMRFLGELYNYEHVDSSVIFETLYLILIFGHGTPEVWMYKSIFSPRHGDGVNSIFAT